MFRNFASTLAGITCGPVTMALVSLSLPPRLISGACRLRVACGGRARRHAGWRRGRRRTGGGGNGSASSAVGCGRWRRGWRHGLRRRAAVVPGRAGPVRAARSSGRSLAAPPAPVRPPRFAASGAAFVQARPAAGCGRNQAGKPAALVAAATRHAGPSWTTGACAADKMRRAHQHGGNNRGAGSVPNGSPNAAAAAGSAWSAGRSAVTRPSAMTTTRCA